MIGENGAYSLQEVYCMQKWNWKSVLFWVVLAEAAGALAGLISMQGIKEYNQSVIQPPFSPPMWIFPVVWGILYGLMGLSAYLISQEPQSKLRMRGLNLMVGQLIVNFFWPLLFFNAQAYGFSLLWLGFLWILVLWMILTFRQVKPLAAWLQIPYLLWLSFAFYLNAGVWYLN